MWGGNGLQNLSWGGGGPWQDVEKEGQRATEQIISAQQQSVIDVLAEDVVKPSQRTECCFFINITAVALPNRLGVGRCG